jgi:hypothetical protein
MLSAGWVAVVIPTLITAVAVAAFTISDRRARRREIAAGPDGLDRLVAGWKATWQQNHAWPPGAGRPVTLVPAPAGTVRYGCGCVRIFWSDGTTCKKPCTVHDRTYWERLERREGISS